MDTLRRRVYTMVRDRWCRQHLESEVSKGGEDQAFSRRLDARKRFSASSNSSKAAVVRTLMGTMDANTVEYKLLQVLQERYQQDQGTQGRSLNARSCLLTFNGPWGVLDSVERRDANKDVDDLAAQLRHNEEVSTLWKDAVQFAQWQALELGATCWASCLDFSSQTWANESKCRLHLHVYLASTTQRLRTRREELVTFRGSRAAKSHMTGLAALASRGRNRVSDAGDFYVQAEQIGQVHSAGSRAPFIGYVVSPEWVTNLLYTRKITPSSARSLFARCIRQAQRNLQNLRVVETAAQEEALQDLIKSTQHALRCQEHKQKESVGCARMVDALRSIAPSLQVPGVGWEVSSRQEHICRFSARVGEDLSG